MDVEILHRGAMVFEAITRVPVSFVISRQPMVVPIAA
jgi:hypothetical protein